MAQAAVKPQVETNDNTTEKKPLLSGVFSAIDISREIEALHDMGLLNRLLEDKSTQEHITWSTNEYTDLGVEYEANRQILPKLILDAGRNIIRPRSFKSKDVQRTRTRKKGEVFTPIWIVKKMNDYLLEEARVNEPNWQKFIDLTMLEITCGEAPFLVTRYDSETGERIAIKDRVGLLDAKLREVTAHTNTQEDWVRYSLRAVESTYGYEYQGDSLLIARINVVMTIWEYFETRWGHAPDRKDMRKVANRVAWNIFQMDGLTGRVPTVPAPVVKPKQISMFDVPKQDEVETALDHVPCRIFDWRANHSQLWSELG